MKGERGTFRRSEIDAVTSYCLRECDYLVELMDQLRDACADAALLGFEVDEPHPGVGALLHRGGARQLLQHLADQSRLEVSRPRSVETTALGAATMAGLALGGALINGAGLIRFRWSELA